MSMLAGDLEVVEETTEVPESDRCVWAEDLVTPHGVRATWLLLALCCGWSRTYCNEHAESLRQGLAAISRLHGDPQCTQCGSPWVSFSWIELPKGGA